MSKLLLLLCAFMILLLTHGCGSNTFTRQPSAESVVQAAMAPPQSPETTYPVPENIHETSYLKDEPGFIGSELGATVQSVLIDNDNELKTIDILIPDVPAKFETLEVVDKNNKALPLRREPKIIRDYENNNVGVKLFVSPKRNIDFKLRLSSEVNDNN